MVARQRGLLAEFFLGPPLGATQHPDSPTDSYSKLARHVLIIDAAITFRYTLVGVKITIYVFLRMSKRRSICFNFPNDEASDHAAD